MTTAVKPIPDGYHSATPYLCVKDAARAIEFYKQAFGATESLRLADAGGTVRHAEIKIAGASIMLADEFPDMNFRSPQSYGGSPVSLYVYVEDVDAFVDRAVAAGATLVRPVTDEFYGDRAGVVDDPFGHRWSFGTHREDVSPEELQRRFAAFCS